MPNLLKKALHDYYASRASADARLLPVPKIRREPSASEREAQYQPQGYGLLFCFHSKSYFEPCTKCQRDKQIARLNYERFCKRHGIASEG